MPRTTSFPVGLQDGAIESPAHSTARTAVVAAGVAALVARSPLTLTVLTVTGAAYLVRLGVECSPTRRPRTPTAILDTARRISSDVTRRREDDRRSTVLTAQETCYRLLSGVRLMCQSSCSGQHPSAARHHRRPGEPDDVDGLSAGPARRPSPAERGAPARSGRGRLRAAGRPWGSNRRRREKALGVGPYLRRRFRRSRASARVGRVPAGTHHRAVDG